MLQFLYKSKKLKISILLLTLIGVNSNYVYPNQFSLTAKEVGEAIVGLGYRLSESRLLRFCIGVYIGVKIIRYVINKDTNKDKDLSTVPFFDSKQLASSESMAGDMPEDIEKLIDMIKNPEPFEKVNAEVPKGILLTGSPGVGKTALARRIAHEANCTFIPICASDVFKPLWGQSETYIKNIFEAARKATEPDKSDKSSSSINSKTSGVTCRKKAIIFIDEIDALSSRDTASQNQASTINTLLTQMDGFKQNNNVIVIAATNYPERIDPAMKRSGRFDMIIEIPEPSLKNRESILKHYLEKHPYDPSINIIDLASQTNNFVGADLENMVKQAALRAGFQRHVTIGPDDLDHGFKTTQRQLFDAIKLSVKREILPYAFHDEVDLDRLIKRYTKPDIKKVALEARDIVQQQERNGIIRQKHINEAIEHVSVSSLTYEGYSFSP